MNWPSGASAAPAEQHPASAKFRQMADRIDHNKDSTFAGAAVICFPSGQQGGVIMDPIDMLILDSSAGPAQFLATLQTRIAMLMKDIEDRERTLNPSFGRR